MATPVSHRSRSLSRQPYGGDRYYYGDERLRHGGGRHHHEDDRVHHGDDRIHHIDDRIHHIDDRIHHGDDRAHYDDSRLHYGDNRLPHGDDRLRYGEDELNYGDIQISYGHHQLRYGSDQLGEVQDMIKSFKSLTSIGKPKRRFRSYRLKGQYERPWLDDPRMKKTRVNSWIIRIFMLVGVALSGYVCFSTTRKQPKHQYCLILDDDFKTLDKNVWSHEVQIDGFGVGSFDWSTTDPKNSFVDAEGLHIVPTLTNETTNINNDKIFNGYTLNLTKAGGDGSCTGTANFQCAIHSNSTLGTLIPPVRSARLITKGKKTIKYGRIEVVAKMPAGDWLWPAIWMMPEDSVYGVWPRSGEIDIAESRGNTVDYVNGGRDVYTTSLHWGPTVDTDAYWRTTNGKAIRRTDFSDGYHTFGMEWSEDYLYLYLDTRLVQVFFIKFNEPMWTRGHFASIPGDNNTVLQDPWGKTGRPNTPFDQPFYLILNVAVGSRNGFFQDNQGGKPWLDAGASAQWDFYKAADSWLPTWGEGDNRGMTVKSVKMWQQGACPT